MSDQKINEKYLEKGIYFEATPLYGGFGNVYHSYLVYRDGNGNAEVIRGGSELKDLMELTIEAGVDISDTKDKYNEKDTIEKRIITKLDLKEQDIKEVWDNAVITAKSIDPRIDYEFNTYPTLGSLNTFNFAKNLVINNQIILSENAQVCHSVTGTVLKSMGLNIDDVLKQANMTKVSVNGIETNLLDIKNLDIGTIDTIKEKITLTEQEIKDEVYERVREYVHENGITSFKDIGQFMEKVREELKNGTIKIENKEQNLKEIQEEPKEENHSLQVYRR